jgi:uncharacterized membrane protein
MLIVGSAAPTSYIKSPILPLRDDGRKAAFGLERITRHPAWCGFALVFGAHMLLAPHLTGMLFSAGWIALSIGGAWHQKRRLVHQRGEAYLEYLHSTSAIPFLAIACGRQLFVASELPWLFLALGAGAAYGIRLLHSSLFVYDGLPVTGVLVAITAWFSIYALAGPKAPS